MKVLIINRGISRSQWLYMVLQFGCVTTSSVRPWRRRNGWKNFLANFCSLAGGSKGFTGCWQHNVRWGSRDGFFLFSLCQVQLCSVAYHKALVQIDWRLGFESIPWSECNEDYFWADCLDDRLRGCTCQSGERSEERSQAICSTNPKNKQIISKQMWINVEVSIWTRPKGHVGSVHLGTFAWTAKSAGCWSERRASTSASCAKWSESHWPSTVLK